VRARTCTRVGTDEFWLSESTSSAPDEAFKKTQGRFSSNASAFWMERKGVFFHEQKQKEILHGKGHKKRSSAELQPLLTLNLIL